MMRNKGTWTGLTKRGRRLQIVAAFTSLATILGPAPGAFAATATHLSVSTQPSGAVNGVDLTGQPVVQLLDGSAAVDTADSTTTVTASIASGVGTLSGTTTVLATAGVATFSNLRIIGTVGSFTLTFTASTGITPATSASFALAFGAATSLAMVTQPNGAITGPNPFLTQPVVRVVDSGGNTVSTSSASVSVAISSGTGGLSGASVVAATSGVATYAGLYITATGTTGPFTLIFTSTGLASVTSASFVVSNTPTALAITPQPSGAVSGVAFTTQPVVRMVDSTGLTVSGYPVNVTATISSGTGTLSGAVTVLTVNGVATFTNLAITGTGPSFTLTFTSGWTPYGTFVVTSAAFAVTTFGAAAASAITIQPSGAVSGAVFTSQPVVRIVDAGGNTVTNSSVNVVASIGSGSGTLSGTTTLAAVNGVVTFTDLAITGTAGSFTLIFTPTSLTSITSASFVLNGVATASAITIQPSGAVSGAIFATQPVVRIVDADGNTVTNSTADVTVAIASGTGALSGTITVAAVAGIAIFSDLAITGTPGAHTLIFTPTGLAPVSSGSINLIGAASASAIVTQPSGATSGVALITQPVIRIVDSVGNTVTNSTVSVTAAIASGGGALSGKTSVAAANGVATFTNLAITGPAGPYTLMFTPTGLTPVTSSSFTVSGTASASAITIQPSGAVSGAIFATQPVVRIVDAGGNTVTNSTVSVVAYKVSGTGTLSGTLTVAAVNGIATFTDLTITGTPGAFTLQFAPAGLTPITSASFTLAGPAIASAIITQPSGAASGTAISTQPVIRIIDINGTTVSNSTVSVLASIASGNGSLSGATTVSAVNGVATFTNLAITGATGAFTLMFTPTGLTPVTSASVSLTYGTATDSAITTQPSGAVSGSSLTTQPAIRILDSAGNTVTNSAVNVVASIASGTGTLSGTLTVATVNGIATFTNLAITGTAGLFTLTFTPTGLTSITSSSFSLAPAIVSGGGSTAPVSQPTTPTATIENPYTQVIKLVEDFNVNVLFKADGAPSVKIAVTAPRGSLSSDVTVTIAPAVSPLEVSMGIVSAKVTATNSVGALITRFNKPLTLNLGKVASGSIAAYSHDGFVWKIMVKLDGITLPDGLDEGYYIASDGSLIILTRHLTYFGVKRSQIPLTVNAPTVGITMGSNVKLGISGGSGTGSTTFVNSTPLVCSVDSSGTVTGLKVGTCTLSASKSGDGTYLNIASNPVDLTFVDLVSQKVVPRATSVKTKIKAKKGLTVTKLDASWLIQLNLGSVFRGKSFRIQIRSADGTAYRVLAAVRLNKLGIASVTQSEMTVDSTLRVLSNYRTIAQAKII